MENSELDSDLGIFKKPILPTKVQSKQTDEENQSNESSDGLEQSDEKKIDNLEIDSTPDIKASKINSSTATVPYNEPSWGGLPDVLYMLEEMKSGVSLNMIPLDQRSFYCFGRSENCHVVMAHPTVSRHHAILQFRSTFNTDDERKGFYLFDLGSTHGTFLNKERIMPRNYVKIQVGHIIKFGTSSRFFLLHGPKDDQEAESNFSYTELVEMRKKEIEQRQSAYLEELTKTQAEESKGIDWGMGEDADEETDLTENPFAVTTNEDMYRDDPKKVLRIWFERRGEELNYDVEEKGLGQFRCTVRIPIEYSNDSLIAEAVVSGRKKEAVFQCALEACRILDRNGLLKQTNNESKKRKIKNWEEQDYYDSDEDSFFDRTGDLETKRKQRMKQVKQTQEPADTYDTLLEKLKVLQSEMQEVESKLNRMSAAQNTNYLNDSIDSFVSYETSGQIVDKLEQRKYRNLLTKLKSDEERIRKLINIVKPYELPEIKPIFSSASEEIKNVCTTIELNEVPQRENVKKTEISVKTETKHRTEKLKPKEILDNDTTKHKHVSAYSVSGYLKSSPQTSNLNNDLGTTKVKKYVNQLVDDYNNIEWIPPSDQTGDGRTSLNEKLGY